MTRDEWVEIVEWLGDRFTRPWSQKQIEAYYWDLQGFSLGAVKEAIHALYAKGLTRPPTGSEIQSLTASISNQGDTVRIPMDICRHLPMDDEGYCTTCGGFPKLGKLNDEDIPLDQISAETPKQRELLPTVIGDAPPEVPY